MASDWLTGVIAAIGVLVGAAITLFGQWLSDKRAADAVDKAYKHEAMQELKEDLRKRGATVLDVLQTAEAFIEDDEPEKLRGWKRTFSNAVLLLPDADARRALLVAEDGIWNARLLRFMDDPVPDTEMVRRQFVRDAKLVAAACARGDTDVEAMRTLLGWRPTFDEAWARSEHE